MATIGKEDAVAGLKFAFMDGGIGWQYGPSIIIINLHYI